MFKGTPLLKSDRWTGCSVFSFLRKESECT